MLADEKNKAKGNGISTIATVPEIRRAFWGFFASISGTITGRQSSKLRFGFSGQPTRTFSFEQVSMSFDGWVWFTPSKKNPHT